MSMWNNNAWQSLGPDMDKSSQGSGYLGEPQVPPSYETKNPVSNGHSSISFDMEKSKPEGYPSLEDSYGMNSQSNMPQMSSQSRLDTPDRSYPSFSQEPKEAQRDDKIKNIMAFFPNQNQTQDSRPPQPATPQPQAMRPPPPNMKVPTSPQQPPIQNPQPVQLMQQQAPMTSQGHFTAIPHEQPHHQYPQSQPVYQPPQQNAGQYWEQQYMILRQQYIASEQKNKQFFDQINSSFDRIVSFMEDVEKRLFSLEKITKDIAKNQRSGEGKEGYIEAIKTMSQMEADRDLAKKLQDELNSDVSRPKPREEKKTERPTPSSSFSSSSSCPICDKKFPASEIDDHVNSCLDTEKGKTEKSKFGWNFFGSRKKDEEDTSKSDNYGPPKDLVPVYPYYPPGYPTYATRGGAQPLLYYTNMPQASKK